MALCCCLLKSLGRDGNHFLRRLQGTSVYCCGNTSCSGSLEPEGSRAAARGERNRRACALRLEARVARREPSGANASSLC